MRGAMNEQQLDPKPEETEVGCGTVRGGDRAGKVGRTDAGDGACLNEDGAAAACDRCGEGQAMLCYGCHSTSVDRHIEAARERMALAVEKAVKSAIGMAMRGADI